MLTTGEGHVGLNLHHPSNSSVAFNKLLISLRKLGGGGREKQHIQNLI
jgi:hypothetical protein